MILVLLISVFIFQIRESFNCPPKVAEELSNSYIPVGIQAIYHYMTELKKYEPYTYTVFCQFPTAGKNTNNKSKTKPQSTGRIKTISDVSTIPLITDICVTETLLRLHSLLLGFGNEAAEKNLNSFQGFSHSILKELESTSKMTSSQQLHFILKKLTEENIESERIKCQMSLLIQDLENPKSKSYRNFLNVKPLSYLNRR